MSPAIERRLRSALGDTWDEMATDTAKFLANGQPGTTIKFVTAEIEERPGKVAACAILVVGEEEAEAAIGGVDAAMRALAADRGESYHATGAAAVVNDELVIAMDSTSATTMDMATARLLSSALLTEPGEEN